MKKVLFIAMLFLSMHAMAQETYSNAEMVTQDLNGTARYVGMGGAMEALGADLSTIGTNPAGIGLYRRSQVAISGGFVSQSGAGSSKYGDATNASFDQAGFVWSAKMRGNRYLNIAFNYHKSRNFNNVTSVAGDLGGAALNKNSYMDLMDAYTANPDGDWLNSNTVSQLDALYYNAFFSGDDGNTPCYGGTRFTHDFSQDGYVGDYEINISGNVSSRVYLGLTFGFQDLNYNSYSSYTEQLVDASNNSIGSMTVTDHRRIDGTGFNLKAGIIFFPIENCPFRIGASVATPTWYDMTSYSNTYINNNTSIDNNPNDPNGSVYADYSYRVYTPWKFGVSLGHTIGNFLALGASYEYADYSSISSRYLTGYDYYSGSSVKDHEMNNNTQHTLKGVSTVKVGAEWKATQELAVRLGYNFVSAMYRKDGFRDCTVNSLGTYFSSRADYVNWHDTNRITCGLGYSIGNFAIDLAYQYNLTKGTYYPFMSSSADYTMSDGDVISVVNDVKGTSISNKRHQFLATLSYKF